MNTIIEDKIEWHSNEVKWQKNMNNTFILHQILQENRRWSPMWEKNMNFEGIEPLFSTWAKVEAYR